MASMRMRFISLAALLAVALGLFGLTANARAGMPYPTPTPPSTPTLTGDVDCSDRVDSVDAGIVLQITAGLITIHRYTQFAYCWDHADMDVNRDAVVDALDAVLILQYHARLLDRLAP